MPRKTVSVKWNSVTNDARELAIYGSNVAYSNPSDLYGNSAGTKVHTFKKSEGDASYTFESDFEYVGIRSNSGALYLDEIDKEEA